jgi:hypothetical protein
VDARFKPGHNELGEDVMTIFLAIWGAALSTILAIWSIYKDLRDRGALRIEAYISEWDEKDEETNEDVRKYEIEIILTNIGRRPVIVHSIGFGNCKGARLYIWRKLPPGFRLHRSPPEGFYEAILNVEGKLPKRLEPAEFVSLKRTNLRFLENDNTAFFALDSLSRYYLLPKAAWDRMRRNYNPVKPRESTLDHIIGKVRY